MLISKTCAWFHKPTDCLWRIGLAVDRIAVGTRWGEKLAPAWRLDWVSTSLEIP